MTTRPNYDSGLVELPPGRYRVFGFPPITGLMLDKWIEVTPDNSPGCYGPADIEIGTAIPNLVRIEDIRGLCLWEKNNS